MNSPNLWYILRLKTNTNRGSHIHHIYMRNIEAETVGRAGLRINYYYGNESSGSYLPSIHDIFMENVHVTETVLRPLDIYIFKNNPAYDIYLTNCTFISPNNSSIKNVKNLCIDSAYVNGHQLLLIAQAENLIQAESYASTYGTTFSDYQFNPTGYGYLEAVEDSVAIYWELDSSMFSGNRISFMYKNTGTDTCKFLFNANQYLDSLYFPPGEDTDMDTLRLEIPSVQSFSKLLLQTFDQSASGFLIDKIQIENAYLVVQQSKTESAINIYPNPVKDYLVIDGIESSKINRGEIYQLDGRLVKSIDISSSERVFSLGELRKGAYMLVIYTNDSVEALKISKE